MASCGRFLLSDFIPKKYDLYSLKKVHDDIVKIQDSVDDQLSRLRKFDDTFCQTCKWKFLKDTQEREDPSPSIQRKNI